MTPWVGRRGAARFAKDWVEGDGGLRDVTFGLWVEGVDLRAALGL